MSNGAKMTEEQRDRLTTLAACSDRVIDTAGIPEAPAGAWASAEIGRFYRPKKEAVTIRLDADILEYFRQNAEGGHGYQTGINAALREHVGRKRGSTPA